MIASGSQAENLSDNLAGGDVYMMTAKKRAELIALIKDLNLELFTTGPAARLAGVDRRTFIKWAKDKNIKPIATLEGNKAVYLKEDVEKIARAIKNSREK